MSLSIVASPNLFETEENQEMFEFTKTLSPPKYVIRRNKSYEVYRRWEIPAGTTLEIRTQDRQILEINSAYNILMPGVAGFPYEGGLPHAEGARATTWFVRKSSFGNHFYREYEVSRTFMERFFTKDGNPISHEEIAAFTVPEKPSVSGMHLPAYAKHLP